MSLKQTTFTTWVDRIEKWPWSKTVILVGIFTFLGCQVILLATGAFYTFFPRFQPDKTDEWLVQQWMNGFDDILQASLWAMGIGGGVLGIKRMATKAEVIEAETRAGVNMTATGRETGEVRAVDETEDGGKANAARTAGPRA